ncbi:MAG: DUF2147 domain-containing protein [Bacteroidales bacterium]|nr:DUF2147 domain-containing protein [Bacteroidales bacterium]
MMKSLLKSLFTLAGLFLASMTLAQTQGADAIIGKWLNEDKDAHVQIYKENGKFYGKIVWLNEPNEPATGLPKLDDDNEDESLRSRPVMGLIMLKDFIYDGDGEWEDGTIYDPKNGKTYDCYMNFDEDGVLKIRGYIGISWIGRNTYWTRVK